MCTVYISVSGGLCSTAEKDPVVFGFNKTSGCLLPVSLQSLTDCTFLRSAALHEHVDLNKMCMFNSTEVFFFYYRESVRSMQQALLNATHVARNGRPDPQSVTDWVDITGKHFFFFKLRNNMCIFPSMFITITTF